MTLLALAVSPGFDQSGCCLRASLGRTPAELSSARLKGWLHHALPEIADNKK